MKPTRAQLNEWYEKLRNSGFKDIEYADGTLHNFNSERGKQRQLKRNIEDNTEYYRLAAQYSHCTHLSELDRNIWTLHADGVSEAAIAEALQLRENHVRRVIRIHKTILTARVKLGKTTNDETT